MGNNFKYIDIHTHILPGVDDGAKDIGQSMQMLEAAAGQGAEGVLLTPHYIMGQNKYSPDILPEIFGQLKEQAAERLPELTLYLGNEILYEDGIWEHVKSGQARTLNGTRFVLVEFMVQIPYRELYRAVRECIDVGYQPVIAHVERYSSLKGRMGDMYELEEMGVYFQMNAESIPGKRFDEQGRWCRNLLKEGFITFLGTDAHDMGRRAPYMADAYAWMEKHLDPDYIRCLCSHFPSRMLNDKYPR